MLDKTLTKITEIPLNMRLWTVDEYYRMAKAGILQSDERVELIAASPVSSEQLTTRVSEYQAARAAATAATAAAKKATAAKDETLASLIEDMRSILRYAENEVKYDDKQLTLLGWGGRTRPNTLQSPDKSAACKPSVKGMIGYL
ncbi:MAG: hypothetical protein GDA56_14910 [Hormoscilla sp. GM7CHS1pb]|nr:hypothetical protein [Hormoscilla sp. GM7CHS1pb]